MRTETSGFVGSRDFARIERAIEYLAEHRERQPQLAELAAHLRLSKFHCNRLFRRWTGITPKQFVEVLTAQVAVEALGAGQSALQASSESGLSGAGRLHDLMVQMEGATPGDIRRRGRGLELIFGTVESPFGSMTCALASRGITHLAFGDTSLDELRLRWPGASLRRDDAAIESLARQIFAARSSVAEPLRLWVQGTQFQVRVWRALLKLDGGQTTSYGQLARDISAAGSARAVGNAVGANPIAWLIPCHQVLRANGALGGYRWGTARKRAMLAYDSLRRHKVPSHSM